MFVAIYVCTSLNLVNISEVSFSLFMIHFPFESAALAAFGSTQGRTFICLENSSIELEQKTFFVVVTHGNVSSLLLFQGKVERGTSGL